MSIRNIWTLIESNQYQVTPADPQVYRGRLVPALGALEVAVKVQRPNMVDTIALDQASF